MDFRLRLVEQPLMKGTQVELLQLLQVPSNGCDSTVNVTLTFNALPVAGIFTNTSCQGSGFSTTIGGTIFNEGNPSGTATIIAGATNGCDSTVNVTLTFNVPPAAGSFFNDGCEGDGFTIDINGTTL